MGAVEKASPEPSDFAQDRLPEWSDSDILTPLTCPHTLSCHSGPAFPSMYSRQAGPEQDFLNKPCSYQRLMRQGCFTKV